MLRRRHICMAAALQLLRRLIIVWELRVVDSATVICYGVVRVKRIRESLVFTSELAMTQSHETDVFSLYLHTHIGKRQLSWSFSTIMGNFFTT